MRRVARRIGHLEACARRPRSARRPSSDDEVRLPAPARTRPTADPSGRRRAAWRCRAASRDRPGAARRARARTPGCADARARSCRSRRRDRDGCASAGCACTSAERMPCAASAELERRQAAGRARIDQRHAAGAAAPRPSRSRAAGRETAGRSTTARCEHDASAASATDYTDGSRSRCVQPSDPSAVLTAVARLVAEAPSLRDVVSRLAVDAARRDSVRAAARPAARSRRVGRRSTSPRRRASSRSPATGSASAGRASTPADADARSRMVCTVRQGTRVHGALWLTSTPTGRLHRRPSGADRQRRRPARRSPSSTTRSSSARRCGASGSTACAACCTRWPRRSTSGSVFAEVSDVVRGGLPHDMLAHDLLGRGRRVVPHLRAGRRGGRPTRRSGRRSRSPATTARSSTATPTSSTTSTPRSPPDSVRGRMFRRFGVALGAARADAARQRRLRLAVLPVARRPTRSAKTTSTSRGGWPTTWRWRCRTSGWPRRRAAMPRRARPRRGSRRRSPR